jgi:hypothetical protein
MRRFRLAFPLFESIQRKPHYGENFVKAILSSSKENCEKMHHIGTMMLQEHSDLQV